MDKIDSVLAPYEPEQRPDINTLLDIQPVCGVSRIPPLVDRNGVMDRDFQEFYSSLVKELSRKDLTDIGNHLINYFLPNLTLSVEDICTWLKTSKYFCKQDRGLYSYSDGFDVQLDVSVLQDTHRTMLLKFNICTWILQPTSNDFSDKETLKLVKETASLTFTFKHCEFRLLPVLEPFKICE